MIFTKEQLNTFIALYENEFNEKLDMDDAENQANALVVLVKNTYKPISKNDLKKYGPCKN